MSTSAPGAHLLAPGLGSYHCGTILNVKLDIFSLSNRISCFYWQGT